MKRTIAAVGMVGILGLALAGTARAANPPVDVYIVAGQSNATGQGRLADLPTGFRVDPRVWLYSSPYLKNGVPPLAWIPLRAASESPEKFGPELTFGSRMQEVTNYRPVALIKHAVTATSLAVDWKPGKDANDRAHWGPMFEALVGTVDAGLKGLRDKGFEPQIKGMIWQQGESDADFLEPALAYAANLKHFIGRIREQFHSPDMVFVYGFVLPPGTFSSCRDIVRTAQGAIDQDSGSVWAVKNAFVVFTDDLSHRAHDPNTTDPKDHIHFGAAGLLELGRRMAETMNNKGKTGR